MDIVAKITDIVAQTVEEASGVRPELAADTALLEDGHLDSLTTLQVFTNLQTEFGVELDFDDLTEETFGSVQAIADLVSARTA